MEWLNYHHLLYFWVVAREGSVAKACEVLRLAQPTISGQIRKLERRFGAKLFEKKGRGLELTETGRLVYRFASEIFALGQELDETLKGRPTGRPVRLAVGVADVIPKLVTFRILEPLLRLPETVRLHCREDRPLPLLADLVAGELDLVLADAPPPPSSNVKVFSHLLGECGVSFLGVAALAGKTRRDFPRSLSGKPLLLPTEGTALRRSLDDFFRRHAVTPSAVSEFEDTALLKVFGEAGLGVFAVPSVIEKEATASGGVKVLGRTKEIRERYYAITVERRITHPAVAAVSELARTKLFG